MMIVLWEENLSWQANGYLPI